MYMKIYLACSHCSRSGGTEPCYTERGLAIGKRFMCQIPHDSDNKCWCASTVQKTRRCLIHSYVGPAWDSFKSATFVYVPIYTWRSECVYIYYI